MWFIGKNKKAKYKNIASARNCRDELIYLAEKEMSGQGQVSIFFSQMFFTLNNTDIYYAYWVEPNGKNAEQNAKELADTLTREYKIEFCVTKRIYYAVYPLQFVIMFNLSKKIIYKSKN